MLRYRFASSVPILGLEFHLEWPFLAVVLLIHMLLAYCTVHTALLWCSGSSAVWVTFTLAALLLLYSPWECIYKELLYGFSATY